MKPEHLRDDLRSEVILILLEKPQEKIEELYRNRELGFYAAGIIFNLIKNGSNSFYKTYRRQVTDVVPESMIIDQGLEERLRREQNYDKAVELIQSLEWYDRNIVELYLQLGNYRAIEKETKIPWESAYHTVQKAIKKIKQHVTV